MGISIVWVSGKVAVSTYNRRAKSIFGASVRIIASQQIRRSKKEDHIRKKTLGTMTHILALGVLCSPK